MSSAVSDVASCQEKIRRKITNGNGGTDGFSAPFSAWISLQCSKTPTLPLLHMATELTSSLPPFSSLRFSTGSTNLSDVDAEQHLADFLVRQRDVNALVETPPRRWIDVHWPVRRYSPDG